MEVWPDGRPPGRNYRVKTHPPGAGGIKKGFTEVFSRVRTNVLAEPVCVRAKIRSIFSFFGNLMNDRAMRFV